jgi:hypothetical protein
MVVTSAGYVSYKAVFVVTLLSYSPLTAPLHDLHLCTYKHTLLLKPCRRSQPLENTVSKLNGLICAIGFFSR